MEYGLFKVSNIVSEYENDAITTQVVNVNLCHP